MESASNTLVGRRFPSSVGVSTGVASRSADPAPRPEARNPYQSGRWIVGRRAFVERPAPTGSTAGPRASDVSRDAGNLASRRAAGRGAPTRRCPASTRRLSSANGGMRHRCGWGAVPTRRRVGRSPPRDRRAGVARGSWRAIAGARPGRGGGGHPCRSARAPGRRRRARDGRRWRRSRGTRWWPAGKRPKGYRSV